MFDLTKLCKNRNVWITSDIHAFHKGICRGTSHWDDKSSCRDFDTIEQMNDTIFNNINKVVNPDDILIHLGDFAFGGRENVISARKRIDCSNLITLYGNHNSGMRDDEELQKLFLWAGDYLEFTFEKTFICCFHYPLLTWNGMGRNSICLTGHEHTKRNLFNRGKTMDVGMDSNFYNVYNLSEILLIMSKIKTNDVHHSL